MLEQHTSCKIARINQCKAFHIRVDPLPWMRTLGKASQKDKFKRHFRKGKGEFVFIKLLEAPSNYERLLNLGMINILIEE